MTVPPWITKYSFSCPAARARSTSRRKAAHTRCWKTSRASPWGQGPRHWVCSTHQRKSGSSLPQAGADPLFGVGEQDGRRHLGALQGRHQDLLHGGVAARRLGGLDAQLAEGLVGDAQELPEGVPRRLAVSKQVYLHMSILL